ncbi:MULTISPECIES: RNA polymerase sigma factor [Fictibacillus]|uniref:RNA polymerase sigma factor n=1 Tax=Fictibacillus TaxID=1329200 RepID=UPI0011A19E1D|nr:MULTISPECIES: RNA polymerase sigma factor [Fictibacillus]MBH0170244.1 RNA polymerase sigma factor [Fictibacillus sp. 18YEL24]
MKKEERIKQWFTLYHNDIYNFLIYYLGTKDVEDMVQEAFVKGFKYIDQFEQRADPKTWLISIARNIAIDHIRKTKRQYALVNQLKSIFSEKSKLPHDWVLEDERKKELYEAITELKASYRDVVILRGILDFTPEETSHILKWKIDKVNLTYYRSVQSLKKKLTSEKWSDYIDAINR